MNVVSLFNGMGTLRQALSDLNITVYKYYSSEIKPYAIELQQHHFPDVIQVGDINNWREWDIDWAKVGLIGSGSPCQDLSIAGKHEGLKGDRSSLFYTFVDILNHVKSLNPNVLFLQENVGSAPIEAVGEMSRALGVYPVRWNSSLMTAQMRDRYYWTNINIKPFGMFGDFVVDIPEPKNQNIKLSDILTSGTVKVSKHIALLERMQATLSYSDRNSDKCQAYMLKREKKSMLTLINDNGYNRVANKIEMCRLQGFDDNYCDILSLENAGSLLGDGWTKPIISHILSFLPSNEKPIKKKER